MSRCLSSLWVDAMLHVLCRSGCQVRVPLLGRGRPSLLSSSLGP